MKLRETFPSLSSIHQKVKIAPFKHPNS